MISKATIKLIQSLDDKKNRQECGMFIAEGDKMVKEALGSKFEIVEIFAHEEWIKNNRLDGGKKDLKITRINSGELDRISKLKTPNQALALIKIPAPVLTFEKIKDQLCLALDQVQDPGNLGTLIRIADWFGIKHLICSPTTADSFNPKVVQATMGALFRVDVHYVELSPFLQQFAPHHLPIYGTFLDGNSLYNSPLENKGIILFGNESKGISKEYHLLVSHKITIPSFPEGNCNMESLNVSVAAAIVCAEFRRRARV